MLGAALLLAFQLCALAGRLLPQNGVLGELTASSYPYVIIGDKKLHLAPGSLIFDQNNRIILPNYLPRKATVLYSVDSNGDLHEMWILTPEEVANLNK
ncbi:MAG TPA: hypothetical protein VLV32_08030 [Burkholderiales bacterium]|nr:hypothetical protein [Burkholderiales bacterium]